MRKHNYLSVLLIFSLFVSGSAYASTLRQESFGLLSDWTNQLLKYQIHHDDPSLDGGLLCPACGRIHGRCGEAVLPLMLMADRTGDARYVEASKSLMRWMEKIHRFDGAWMNDINVSPWDGTTVFMAISLYETLENHAHLLDDSTRMVWDERLLQSGEFIMANDFIYSRKRGTWRNMNINYSCSATYALYAIGHRFGRSEMMDKAREIASDLIPYFTENNAFIYGEGPQIQTKSKNGCFPIDLLYNVEESLPNLAYYAHMSGDQQMLSLVERSMKSHLELMLPDGAWDNSWGTRNFKWSYWGGRTSDGFMGGYYLLADRHPEFAEAIRRNIGLLRRSSQEALLAGGVNYRDCGVEICIHHTFGHAKALASMLEQPAREDRFAPLPRDKAYGNRYLKDIHTWLFAQGEWRGTITGYDALYKVKGSHPSGGALSMLYHERLGPIFAATMNRYSMVESPNMQYPLQQRWMNGTPRFEWETDSVMYSNLDDIGAKIIHSSTGRGEQYQVESRLVDENGLTPDSGVVRFTYSVTPQMIRISAQIPASLRQRATRCVLPIIASPDESTHHSGKIFELKRNGAVVKISSSTPLVIEQTNRGGRIFNPVPGFCFVPVVALPDSKGRIEIELSIEE